MKSNRRTFIKAGASVSIIGLAGCSQGGIGGGGGGNGGDGSVTVIVPWSQGGGTDRSTRALTPTWSETLGEDFVVENYPGGSTQVGGEKLYNAEADGYTVGMWNLPQMQATWLFQDAPYTAEDFDYIGTNHADPTMWFAPQDSPYSDMTEFLDYARENSVTVGLTSAIGNTALSGLLVRDTYDVDMELVNLEGGTPTRQAVLSGDVDAAVNQPWAFNPSNIGEVTTLGSHTPEQQELWPDTPSFKELGLNDLPLVDRGLVQWKLMMAPGGVEENHPDRYEELVTTYEEAMNSEDYLDRASEQGNLDKIIRYNGPDETESIVQENSEFMSQYESLFEDFISG
ncbi:tripartite tricarboxylate transporter substrate binding protein [Halostella sp. JP-L12]|uniref:tripartite tricarboxylate transporter substrate binding protein n=1 Tax=Halostella TaxID=1843185 RepID=UPI000EF7E8CA|nr:MULTISPECIES: tripartite tricarboxylate transporter substrate binding protein [Halostella]NHN48086.1 tripartite tricarboxylate transporter substrate binding protein [Halostella sp. JP-L12]